MTMSSKPPIKGRPVLVQSQQTSRGCQRIPATSTERLVSGRPNRNRSPDVMLGKQRVKTLIIGGQEELEKPVDKVCGATLRELCPVDKEKVARLIRQVVSVSKERDRVAAQLEEERKRGAECAQRLRAQNRDLVTETASLRAKLAHTYSLLRVYQHKIQVLKASSKVDSLPSLPPLLEEEQTAPSETSQQEAQLPHSDTSGLAEAGGSHEAAGGSNQDKEPKAVPSEANKGGVLEQLQRSKGDNGDPSRGSIGQRLVVRPQSESGCLPSGPVDGSDPDERQRRDEATQVPSPTSTPRGLHQSGADVAKQEADTSAGHELVAVGVPLLPAPPVTPNGRLPEVSQLDIVLPRSKASAAMCLPAVTVNLLERQCECRDVEAPVDLTLSLGQPPQVGGEQAELETSRALSLQPVPLPATSAALPEFPSSSSAGNPFPSTAGERPLPATSAEKSASAVEPPQGTAAAPGVVNSSRKGWVLRFDPTAGEAGAFFYVPVGGEEQAGEADESRSDLGGTDTGSEGQASGGEEVLGEGGSRGGDKQPRTETSPFPTLDLNLPFSKRMLKFQSEDGREPSKHGRQQKEAQLFEERRSWGSNRRSPRQKARGERSSGSIGGVIYDSSLLQLVDDLDLEGGLEGTSERSGAELRFDGGGSRGFGVPSDGVADCLPDLGSVEEVGWRESYGSDEEKRRRKEGTALKRSTVEKSDWQRDDEDILFLLQEQERGWLH